MEGTVLFITLFGLFADSVGSVEETGFDPWTGTGSGLELQFFYQQQIIYQRNKLKFPGNRNVIILKFFRRF